MFKPARVVRSLPYAAALLASVTIAASAESPEGQRQRERLRFEGDQPSPSRPAMLRGETETTMVYPMDATLLARADTLGLVGATYALPAAGAGVATSRVSAPSEDGRATTTPLPRPERWTAIAATLALGAFFFLRRIV